MHSHGSQSRIGKSLLALSQRCSPATEFSRLAWGEQVVSFIMLNSDDLFICLLSFRSWDPACLVNCFIPKTRHSAWHIQAYCDAISLSLYLPLATHPPIYLSIIYPCRATYVELSVPFVCFNE